MLKRTRHSSLIVALAVGLGGCGATQTDITPDEARIIAKEAYIYGYPMMDGYRIMHSYFVDSGGSEFKAPWNELRNIPRVFTPDDVAIQTPNSDTPYSFIGLDLRAEPVVLTVPPIEEERYFSVQLIDLYTHNFDYIGSRATGNDGGNFLIAGPYWEGEAPSGVTKVIRSETDLLLAVYRTQLFNPQDLDNVQRVQAGYQAQSLSDFLGQPAPRAAPTIDFMVPPTSEELREGSLDLFQTLNFLLEFGPTHPSEQELMSRFAKIGIGTGATFDTEALSPELKQAIEDGIADAWASDFADLAQRVEAGDVTSGEAFGSRETLDNNYLYRMGGAVFGIWGNSMDEAMYPVYAQDADGEPLDGANRYTLRFEPGELPPVNAFWSLTMYRMPESLLVANPLDRYLLNSSMLPQFNRDADGGITLYIQNESPGAESEPNWLPAPRGPMIAFMRLYWPRTEALDGLWTQPPIMKVR